VTGLEGAVLGLIQGLTEFLPVSSTAHLLFAQKLMGLAKTNLHLEVATHLGTLGSVVVFYRKLVLDMLRETFRGGPARRLAILVVVGTIPAVIVVLALKHALDLRENVTVAAIDLCIIGCFLLATRFAKPRPKEPGFLDAIVIGVAQCFAAVFPGISRSGSTIGTALFLGNKPEFAAHFSFLLTIPAILGAAVVDAAKEGVPTIDEQGPLLVAAAVAFASGLVAIYTVLRVVARGRLAVFGPYCIAVGVAALIWLA
jgi:undecaprenyl-diphosphatase